MAIYLLSYVDWETYNPTLLEGPETDDWEGLCNSLINPAVRRILEQEQDNWLGWPEVREEVIEGLKAIGYTVLKPTECCFQGSNIIDRPELETNSKIEPQLLQLLVKRNRDLRESL